MKQRTTILVGPKAKERRAVGVETLPGLLLTTPPDKSFQGTHTITHKSSGLYILRGVQESKLQGVLKILRKVDWDVPMYTIYDCEDYRDVVDEAVMYTKKQRSKRQEDRIAKDVGGRTQPGSGAVWGYRRDVVTPEFMIEAKTTRGKSHRAIVKDLEFLRKQAYEREKIPAYIITFEGEGGYDAVLVPTWDYEPDVPAKIEMHNPELGTAITISRDSRKILHRCGFAMTFGKERKSWTALGYEKFLEWAKQHEQ